MKQSPGPKDGNKVSEPGVEVSEIEIKGAKFKPISLEEPADDHHLTEAALDLGRGDAMDLISA